MHMANICYILTFGPSKRRKWHIPMAVMWGNRVGRNWLMKWDELKNSYGTLIDWCTGREWPLNCMSYFRLMTIKHLISKIEWELNDYIIQLEFESQWQLRPVELEFQASWRRDVVGKATPGRGALGNPDGVWGPEKLLIRCSRSPSRVSP